MKHLQQAEHLQQYGDFSDYTIDRVAKIADEMQGMNLSNAGAYLGLQAPNMVEAAGTPLQVAHLRPLDSPDSHDRPPVVFSNSHGNEITPYILLSQGVVAKALDQEVIAFGNRTIGNKSQRIGTIGERIAVAGGNLRSVVLPNLVYLDSIGVTKFDVAGFSGGADKALATAAAAKNSAQVNRALILEPVTAVSRVQGNGFIDEVKGLTRLGGDFISTDKALKAFIEGADLPASTEAHRLSAAAKLKYIGGLSLPTNIAVARNLAHGGLEERVSGALDSQANLRVAAVWGDESEMAPHAAMLAAMDRLESKYPGRVHELQIKGGKHALGDDIFLHAAAMVEASRRATA